MIHFSVITVVKNDLNGLKKSRESLVSQKFKNWTHIIIDGLSNDGTLEYLKSLPKENVIYISESDLGIYNAMNKAWMLADPESYVFYLNARDIFTDDMSLSEASKMLETSPESNWGCTTHEEILENGEGWVCKLVSPPSINNQLYAYGYRSHQGVVMKASFIESLGGFDETYRLAADWDLISRAISAEAPLVWIHPLGRFQLGGESSIRLLKAHMELRQIRQQYLVKNLRHRIYDEIWCAIYLNFLGYKNSWTPIHNLLEGRKKMRAIKLKKNSSHWNPSFLGIGLSIYVVRIPIHMARRFLWNLRATFLQSLNKRLQILEYGHFPQTNFHKRENE
jgi:glycosyltransferase involved in cell wall biosynthesis